MPPECGKDDGSLTPRAPRLVRGELLVSVDVSDVATAHAVAAQRPLRPRRMQLFAPHVGRLTSTARADYFLGGSTRR